MPLVSDSIPNLVNGVSQQPASLRLPSQCELQENGMPSIIEGMRKRPPTKHIKKVMDGQLGEAYFHSINRDVSERYLLIITDGALKVFDLVGNEKTVTYPDGVSYIQTASPETSIRCVTVADHTFVVNRDKTVEMDEEVSPDNGVEAIVFIKQANYKTDYAISIDGVEQATHTTGAGEGTVSDPADPVSSTEIAEDLKSQLVTNLGAGWYTAIQGSVIHIKKDDGTDFEIKTVDSRSDTQMNVTKDSTQTLSDLPIIAPIDFRVKIEGTGDNNFESYYVKFRPNNDTATFDTGVWVETVAPGIPWKFDNSSMPHGIVRESDGTFSLKELEWGAREAGDEVTAKDRSFVGNVINDVFFTKNRLSFLSDENLIMSRADEYFEFFPTTVTTRLDSDPIDIPAPSSSVAILEHALDFNGDTLIFSEQHQFKLEYGDVLNPDTAELVVQTEFESSTRVKPVSGGKTIFFSINQGKFGGILEYFIDGNSDVKDAAEVTGHVPMYIPDGIYKTAVASNEEILLCLTKGARNEVFVYNFYWSSNEKLQSAWHKFVFPVGAKVLNVEFFNTDCYFLMEYNDAVYIEVMSVEPGRQDVNSEIEYQIDRKIDETSLSFSYNASLDETTVTFPYEILGTPRVVSRGVADDSQIEGVVYPILSTNGYDVVVKGNCSDKKIFAGIEYNLRYQLSTIMLRESTAGNSQTKIAFGRLQLRRIGLSYDRTGYFKVRVAALGRDEAVHTFTGKLLGSQSSIIGEIGIFEGFYSLPVLSRNEDVTITIESNSHLPCHFQSAEWEGMFNIRSKRV